MATLEGRVKRQVPGQLWEESFFHRFNEVKVQVHFICLRCKGCHMKYNKYQAYKQCSAITDKCRSTFDSAQHHLRCVSTMNPCEGFPYMWSKRLTQDTFEGLHITSGPGTPLQPLQRAAECGYTEGHLGYLAWPTATVTQI